MAKRSNRKSKSVPPAAPVVVAAEPVAVVAEPVVVAAPAITIAAKPSPSHEQIARRAYELYLKRGAKHGCAHEDWIAAERELAA